MQAMGRLGSFITRGVSTVSGHFLPYGGAVDIVVVQQKDGSFKSSPWFVRFGKLHRVLKASEKVVNISVNGVEPDFHMYMNHKGEAFFLREVHSEEQGDGDSVLYESSSSDEAEDVLPWGNKRQFKSKSCKFDLDRSSSGDLVDVNNGETLNRTSSRRSRILGLVLGQRSFKREVEDGIELMERAEMAADLLELKWSTNLTYDKLPPRDRKETRGDTLKNGVQLPKIKEEAVRDTTSSDLKVAHVELEARIKKKSNREEVSGLSTGHMGNNNSEGEKISAHRVRFPDYHAHAEVLQARTVLLPEVAETAEVTKNNDLGMPVMDVPDLHSQQKDGSSTVVGMYEVEDVGNLPKFQKSHTINVFQRRHAVNRVRANTPTSDQLASLNLKEGRNTVTFSFFTAMLGTQQVEARIYLWKWNTRIVISDVDGTITRSDVLGHFMPMVGIDWSQTGVAHLFSAIQENGYQLLFLSARAISQACHTRRFLFNLKQDGKVLPDGPVVISPDGLFPALYREVIRRAPHEFKIACLEAIKALFPPDCNPFYAGFGNRDTDEISYLKVGIPNGKIFIINPRGEIAVNRCLDTKSYTSLHAVVNGMFPPTDSSEQVKL